MVDDHSKRLSFLGPAVQLHGGSRLISISSFWMRLREVLEVSAKNLELLISRINMKDEMCVVINLN